MIKFKENGNWLKRIFNAMPIWWIKWYQEKDLDERTDFSEINKIGIKTRQNIWQKINLKGKFEKSKNCVSQYGRKAITEIEN